MNKNTIIGALAVIAVLPFLYLFLNAFKGEELPRFRGREVVQIDTSQGTIVVPSSADAAKGAPLTASFPSSFIEQVTTKKMTNSKGLALTLHTISGKLQDCEAQSAIPAQARFEIAQMCAPFAFENFKDAKKTALFVVPEEQLIVFGKSGQNQARVYYNGMVATYESADMTQSDRKYEACLVRIMMDFIIGLPLDNAKTCAVQPS
jgi:hypothetical protein